MEQSQIIVTLIISTVIWIAILWSIIQGATRSKKIERLLRIQANLLAKIAEKQGVTSTEVQEILNIKLRA